MKILVTGCCGYVGSLLVPHLLAERHTVVGVDPQWFGDGFLPRQNKHFTLKDKDIRSLKNLRGYDQIIHLAGMTSDASCQRNEHLAREVNISAFEPLVKKARRDGVRRFILLSSAAAYGSTRGTATEDIPLRPTTLYGEGKAHCERVLFEHGTRDFVVTALRPGGLCGYSPRMRFDLTVNRMVRDGMMAGKISVFGGKQARPNLHIRDLVELIKVVMAAPPSAVAGQAFNAAHSNLSILSTAKRIAKEIGCEIDVQPREDDRSYRVACAKLENRLHFVPKRSIEVAVQELISKFRVGYWKNVMENPTYMNIYQRDEA